MRHLRAITRKPAKADDVYDIADLIANIITIILGLADLFTGAAKLEA
jgi:hypothetical protein